METFILDDVITTFESYGFFSGRNDEIKTVLIVSHGEKCGELKYKSRIIESMRYFRESGYTVYISCCYPYQVAKHNPDIKPHILDTNWRSVKGFCYEKSEKTAVLFRRIRKLEEIRKDK
jgi:hypothetical protein